MQKIFRQKQKPLYIQYIRNFGLPQRFPKVILGKNAEKTPTAGTEKFPIILYLTDSINIFFDIYLVYGFVGKI